jgi:hypothetical protein
MKVFYSACCKKKDETLRMELLYLPAKGDWCGGIACLRLETSSQTEKQIYLGQLGK